MKMFLFVLDSSLFIGSFSVRSATFIGVLFTVSNFDQPLDRLALSQAFLWFCEGCDVPKFNCIYKFSRFIAITQCHSHQCSSRGLWDISALCPLGVGLFNHRIPVIDWCSRDSNSRYCCQSRFIFESRFCLCCHCFDVNVPLGSNHTFVE